MNQNDDLRRDIASDLRNKFRELKHRAERTKNAEFSVNIHIKIIPDWTGSK